MERGSMLCVNAISCRAGGGLNDLRNTLPILREALLSEGWRVKVWVCAEGWAALEGVGYDMADVVLVSSSPPLHRFISEVLLLPLQMRREGASVIFSFSNFILGWSRAPQLVVLRSIAFYSTIFSRKEKRGFYQALRHWFGVFASGYTVKRAKIVFCVSNTLLEAVSMKYPRYKGKLILSYLGVSPPAAKEKSEESWRILCDAYPSLNSINRSNQYVVLNVSSYYEHKNLITLLRALEILVDDGVPVVGVITAGVEAYAGAETVQILEEKRLVRRLIERGVLFDLGTVRSKNVWRLYSVSDVLSFPSILESFGHPLVEAMSVGLPVVASDISVHREVCVEAALYHDVLDSKALSERIACVLYDDQVRRKLATAGKDISKRYSWKRHSEDVAGVIRLLG